MIRIFVLPTFCRIIKAAIINVYYYIKFGITVIPCSYIHTEAAAAIFLLRNDSLSVAEKDIDLILFK